MSCVPAEQMDKKGIGLIFGLLYNLPLKSLLKFSALAQAVAEANMMAGLLYGIVTSWKGGGARRYRGCKDMRLVYSI
jgi:hypothetical protein